MCVNPSGVIYQHTGQEQIQSAEEKTIQDAMSLETVLCPDTQGEGFDWVVFVRDGKD